ncbi:MAG: prephenate dehydrogenase, partial [Chloroflexi bacterium]|nr:prephenate dehydrogenase [Chloroflexota bacterium]
MILRDARVTIVGLGLMGGSLAAALSRSGACREVVGVARREGVVRTARELRFIHWGTTDLAQGVQGADLVVLATPVRSIVHTITQIGPMLAPDCVLLDVGSSKKAICKAMANLPAHVQPIGGHPMCGKESAGLMVAEPDLFLSKVFVLCPLERTAPAALALAREVVTAVGARELVLDPEQHDRMVALISHLPYLMSISLVNAADTLAADDSLVWRLAASGFRDTSRVAAGNPEMMLDILLTNREPIRA